MAAGPCNLQHVDSAIVKAILGRGTKIIHDIGSISDKWSARAFDWYSSIVQKACHCGGLGITPNASSSISAYYSATAQYVSALKWRRVGHANAQPPSIRVRNFRVTEKMHEDASSQPQRGVGDRPVGANGELRASCTCPAPRPSNLQWQYGQWLRHPP